VPKVYSPKCLEGVFSEVLHIEESQHSSLRLAA
jgi:hypothetical protein